MQVARPGVLTGRLPETGFAAFYADCLHDVLPATDGHRLALTWNLIRDNASTQASAPDHAAETEALARHLANWPDDAPAKIAIPLEHAGRDQSVAAQGDQPRPPNPETANRCTPFADFPIERSFPEDVFAWDRNCRTSGYKS